MVSGGNGTQALWVAKDGRIADRGRVTDERARISWLHVSDLHVSKKKIGSATGRRPGGEQWAEVREEFFADLEAQLDATQLEPDLVIITGDLALSGETKQYNDFDAEFLTPLLARLRGRGAAAVLVAVPGNHDVRRPKGNDVLRYRSLLDYDLTDDKDKFVKQLRASLWTERKADAIAPLFESYMAWMERTMLPGLADHTAASGLRVEALHTSHVPGDFSVIVSRGELRLLLVGLNSAWIQFDDSDVMGMLHVPREQLFAALAKDDDTVLRRFDDLSGALLLMHHPRDWLSPDARRTFDEAIHPARDGRFSACLFGHMHEARTESRAISGRNMQHLYQSPSLFGLEHYGETQQRLDVGYTLGAIDEHEGIRLWVRRLVPRGSGVKQFDVDTTIEKEHDGWFQLRPPRVEPRRSSRAGSPGQRTSTASTDPQRATDIEHLRAWLRAHHGELELLSPSDSFPYPFDEVHIPLRLSIHEAWSDSSPNGAHLDRDLVRGDHGTVELAEIFERAQERAAVAIFGEPGAGKTTTLQKIAHQMLLEGGGAVGLPEGALPLFVRLHRLEPDDLQQPDPLLALARREAAQTEPSLPLDVLERLWACGGLLVLLDGLDEVADDELRERLVAHVVGTTTRDRTRGVFRLLSSRYSGVTAAIRRKLDDRFLRLDVQPLDRAGIDRLVRRWYRAALISKKAPRTSDERSRVEVEAEVRTERMLEKLHDAERDDAALRTLLGTPLMLTLLCAIAFVDGNIPTKHRLIYARCVEVLLRRYTEKTGEPAPAPEDELLALLSGVAYELHTERRRNGLSVERIAACRPASLRSTEPKPSELLAWLHKHVGLLTKLGRDDYGFAHLTFQEYFAAREIDQHGTALVDRLADHIGDPWWQEVILLCLSFDRPEVFHAFVRRVLEGDHWHLDVPVGQSDDPDVQARNRPPWLLLQHCWNEARVRPIEVVREVIRRPLSTEVAEAQRARALQLLFGETDDAVVEAALAVGRDPRYSEQVRANARRLVELARGAWVEEPLPTAKPLRSARTMWHAPSFSDSIAAGDITFEPQTGMRLLWVPGGTFLMGSPSGEPDSSDDEQPEHQVTLQGFWLSETLVTIAHYAKFMRDVGAPEPRLWRDRRFYAPDQPVVGVSWQDAQRFCHWLNESRSKDRFGLPSEAQWEYAARGKDGRRFPWGNEPPDETRACFGRSAEGPALVGQFPLGRGPFGHLDLAGGVWEWCQDTWDASAYRHPNIWARVDPVVENELVLSRVCRGGAWNTLADSLRATHRSSNDAEGRGDDLGFRVCLTSGLIGAHRG